jgi:hypothetical protein
LRIWGGEKVRRLQQIRTAPEFSRRKAVADLRRGRAWHPLDIRRDLSCGFFGGEGEAIPPYELSQGIMESNDENNQASSAFFLKYR